MLSLYGKRKNRETPLFSNVCARTLAILYLPITLCRLLLLHLRVY